MYENHTREEKERKRECITALSTGRFLSPRSRILFCKTNSICSNYKLPDATGYTVSEKISDLPKIAAGLSDYLCASQSVWFHCYESITRRAVLRCKNMCISMESESKLNLEWIVM